VNVLLRSFWFTILVLVPGTVTILVPCLLLLRSSHWREDLSAIAGLMVAAVGVAVYLWCAF
jgi:hypothetical protein